MKEMCIKIRVRRDFCLRLAVEMQTNPITGTARSSRKIAGKNYFKEAESLNAAQPSKEQSSELAFPKCLPVERPPGVSQVDGRQNIKKPGFLFLDGPWQVPQVFSRLLWRQK